MHNRKHIGVLCPTQEQDDQHPTQQYKLNI